MAGITSPAPLTLAEAFPGMSIMDGIMCECTEPPAIYAELSEHNAIFCRTCWGYEYPHPNFRHGFTA